MKRVKEKNKDLELENVDVNIKIQSFDLIIGDNDANDYFVVLKSAILSYIVSVNGWLF